MAVNTPQDFAWTLVCSSLAKESHQRAQELLEPALASMNASWRHGQPLFVEDLLAQHPELREAREIVLRILYEEIRLRRRAGQHVTASEVTQRFPEWPQEVEELLAGFRTEPLEPHYPEIGATLGTFTLLRELGRGAQGRVYLAENQALAHRLMVLKITPCVGKEHLALARLQHTHIVPLYAVEDWPALHLRVLVFPYLGRLTLKQILEPLQEQPLASRHGKQILNLLKQAEPEATPAVESPIHAQLAHDSYVTAVCRWGVCLAETLHYAHERGLVHLDVKPSNVVLATDGQPLLLDFHLAQPPLEVGAPLPEFLGATTGYMAPEQERTLAAAQVGRAIPERVDGRADLYALGALLYEALSGKPLSPLQPPLPLSRINPQVSIGLSDIIHRCLAPKASARYASGLLLADDLRRHLEHRPLRSVANRSLQERWRKWRRRHPYVLPLGAVALALITATMSAGLLWHEQRSERRHAAEQTLREGQQLLSQGRNADALRSLKRGQELLAGQDSSTPFARSLAAHARIAQRADQAHELHQLADILRFLYVVEALPPRLVFILEAGCQKAWTERASLLDRAPAPLAAPAEENLKQDLLDLVICHADLQVRLASGAADRQRKALEKLQEAEALFGTSLLLVQERGRYARAVGQRDLAQQAEQQFAKLAPHTAWDHYTVGRGLMRTGKFAPARAELELALAQQPHHFWTNFCLGICAAKLGWPHDAVQAFSVCVGQSPQSPECFVQRGKAFAQLGNADRAHQDFSHALVLRPTDAEACLQRGILASQHKKLPAALADLRRARVLGADPATVHFHLALVRLAQHDHAGALAEVATALQHQPNLLSARELHEKLLKKS